MPRTPLPSEVLAFLADPLPSVMATIRPDGAPRSVATWYLLDGDRILLTLDAERARLRDVRADPRLSLTVLGQNWLRHVSLYGRAASIEDDPDLADCDRIARHYTGAPYRRRERPRVTVTMAIEAWHGWEQGRPWPPRDA